MRTLLTILLLSFISCQQKEGMDTSNEKKYPVQVKQPTEVKSEKIIEENKQRIDEIDKPNGPDFRDTLQRYFERFEIKSIVDQSTTNDTATVFKIGSHVIKWMYNDSATFVSIDNQKIEIKDKNFDVFEGSYSMGGIRLFSINQREILAIQFYANGCGGNCFDGNSLFYDIKTKVINYFYHYAMDCFSLYDFKKDNTIDLLVPTFDGDFHGPFTEKYTLYKLNSNGKFELQKDKSGKDYFISAYYPERSREGDPCRRSAINWVEKIE